MKRIAAVAAVAAFGLAAAPVAAQRDLVSACAGVPAEARSTCLDVAQAGESAQPQLGILIAGGNPVLGTASTSGLRLGVLPRVSASVRINGVVGRIPSILEGLDETDESETLIVPALGANATVGVFPGLSVAPTIGGVGSVDLLGSATWLPFKAVDAEGFEAGSDDFAWGVGARVGLLRESFTMPGVSVSLMRHSLGRVAFGRACENGETVVAPGQTLCPSGGDPGEVGFDLTSWSARGAISKRLLGLGLTAGVGYDRSSSDVDFAFRAPTTVGCTGGNCARVYRFEDRQVKNGRWSAFVDGSMTLLLVTLTAEAGWMQGDKPIPGFSEASEFDPESGSYFGSLGLRISL